MLPRGAHRGALTQSEAFAKRRELRASKGKTKGANLAARVTHGLRAETADPV